jgi:hypothetical protein
VSQNINKAFIPFFDNISTISDYMGDELSKAVTGAGNAVRKLYHDDQDVIREYRRAILLNGLTIPTDKADLLDRILPVALRRVPKEERETERRMRLLFEDRHPKLLGAVLDALSGALAHHEEVRGLPRLADWAEYAIALYKHLDWGGYKGFMEDWAVIEEGQHETTLDSSVLAQTVRVLMTQHDEAKGTPTEVFKLLKDAANSDGIDVDRKDNDFPGSASWLWKKLVPVIPTLEAYQISVSDGHEGRGKEKSRFIRIARFGGGDSKTPGGDSKEKMLTDQKPHRNGLGTVGTVGTANLPENSKYSTKQIDNDGSVLQGGKNTVPTDRPVPTAYLSQKSGDSKADDAVPTSENAVPTSDEQRIDELVRQGMSPSWARAEVLGTEPPISADPNAVENGYREATRENLGEYLEQIDEDMRVFLAKGRGKPVDPLDGPCPHPDKATDEDGDEFCIRCGEDWGGAEPRPEDGDAPKAEVPDYVINTPEKFEKAMKRLKKEPDAEPKPEDRLTGPATWTTEDGVEIHYMRDGTQTFEIDGVEWEYKRHAGEGENA